MIWSVVKMNGNERTDAIEMRTNEQQRRSCAVMSAQSLLVAGICMK